MTDPALPPVPTLRPRLLHEALVMEPEHEDRPLTSDEVKLLAWTREHLGAIRAEIATWSDAAVLNALSELTLLWQGVHGDVPTCDDVSRLFLVPRTWSQEMLNKLFARTCELRLEQIQGELEELKRDKLPPHYRRKTRTRLLAEQRALKGQLAAWEAFVDEHGVQNDPRAVAETER